MDDTTDRPAVGDHPTSQCPARALAGDPQRVAQARRLSPRQSDRPALDRHTTLAATLLGAAAAQVALFEDGQLVATGGGLPDGAVGSGQGSSHLGVPLISNGMPVGALCVFDREPREWSPSDVATLQELAVSVVTELELAALVRESEADRLRWGLAIDAAGIGTFDWDIVSGRLTWDDRLKAMFGYDRDTFDETMGAFTARLHPDDQARLSDILQVCIADCGEYDAEYRVVRPDGEIRWLQARGRAVAGDDGTAVRLLGACLDTTVRRSGEMRVTRVLEAMPAGFYSLDRDWRFTHVNAEAERLLAMRREDLLGRAVWEAFPAAVGSVFEESFLTAVRTGLPISFDAYYPEPVNGWYELRAWPSPEGLSVYFLEVTERRRVQEKAERSARRLAILAHVSAELAGTLDARGATAELSRLVVPGLADFCMVTLVEPDGRPHDVGSWHSDPAARERLERYTAVRLEALPSSSPVARALADGEASRASFGEIDAMMAPGEARDLFEQLAPSSAAVLPMRGRGRTLGLLTLYFGEGRPMAEEDLATAQDVADRAGLALDNARLYSAQQQLAEGLQRSLLTDPPEPDHAEIAVRYLPAAEAARVGGDWYDAFLQPSGSTMLVIGDVVGHDTEAAAAMGQLRGLLRGIATYSGAGPAEVLRGLDTSMTLLQTNTLATATVARFEQTADEVAQGVTRMRWASAGHLPPLVIHPDGSVAEQATWTGDLLLGVDPEAVRTESVVTLARGCTVLLYTDGLIERRDADLDSGMTRLRTALIDLAALPLGELLDELLHRLVDGTPEDDVALVAVRLHPQDRPRPAEAGAVDVPPSVPPDPAQA